VSNEIEALRKEVVALQGHQIALGFVLAAQLTQLQPQDVERVFAVAEDYLMRAGLPRGVVAGALQEIRALRSSYRTS
jgi:hypothetical protein